MSLFERGRWLDPYAIGGLAGVKEGSANTVYSVTLPPVLESWESLEPYANGRFRGVSWHEIPEPSELIIDVDGSKVKVTTFGLQRLDRSDSSVTRHEEGEYELVCPLVGSNATMTIDLGLTCSKNQVTTHPLSGLFTEEMLQGMDIAVLADGSLVANDQPIQPVITRPGDYHATQGGPLTYLVIKGIRA